MTMAVRDVLTETQARSQHHPVQCNMPVHTSFKTALDDNRGFLNLTTLKEHAHLGRLLNVWNVVSVLWQSMVG